MSDSMRINALAPWFGAKRQLAPQIVEELGPHRCYFEPFCGSMAVLLAKPEVSQETVNDLHGDLINLALVIQHTAWGPWLFRKLRRALVVEEMQRIARVQCMEPPTWMPNFADPGRIDEKDATRAFWFFYASWMGRNGVIGTKENNNNFCVRYTMNGGIQGTRFASAVDSIPAWQRRLREVTILRRDGFEILERIEDAPAVSIYCDPPYLSKGAQYVHDFAASDHTRLAALLRRFKFARVVVSYYDSHELEKLYPGWSVRSCPVAKSLVQQGKRDKKGGTVAPEVLLVNGPLIGGAVPEPCLFGDPA